MVVLGSSTLAQTPAPTPTPKDCQAPKSEAPGTSVTQPPADAAAQPCPLAAPQSVQDRFPYPGEASPPAVSKPPASSHPSADAGNPFPYPGDPAASSSSGSSSSSSSSSGAAPDSPEPDAAKEQGKIRRKLPKPTHLQSDEERESEDLVVAKFYRQSGDLNAAYLRTKDAVKLQPGDPEAHFALAEVARHLNKREEAVAEFQRYLKLDPEGDRVKSAQKALAALK